VAEDIQNTTYLKYRKSWTRRKRFWLLSERKL